MNHQQQRHAIHIADRLPPGFTVDLTVLCRQMQRVIEHPLRRVEVDSMLPPIASVLAFIQSKRNVTAYTKQYIHGIRPIWYISARAVVIPQERRS